MPRTRGDVDRAGRHDAADVDADAVRRRVRSDETRQRRCDRSRVIAKRPRAVSRRHHWSGRWLPDDRQRRQPGRGPVRRDRACPARHHDRVARRRVAAARTHGRWLVAGAAAASARARDPFVALAERLPPPRVSPRASRRRARRRVHARRRADGRGLAPAGDPLAARRARRALAGAGRGDSGARARAHPPSRLRGERAADHRRDIALLSSGGVVAVEADSHRTRALLRRRRDCGLRRSRRLRAGARRARELAFGVAGDGDGRDRWIAARPGAADSPRADRRRVALAELGGDAGAHDDLYRRRWQRSASPVAVGTDQCGERAGTADASDSGDAASPAHASHAGNSADGARSAGTTDASNIARAAHAAVAAVRLVVRRTGSAIAACASGSARTTSTTGAPGAAGVRDAARTARASGSARAPGAARTASSACWSLLVVVLVVIVRHRRRANRTSRGATTVIASTSGCAARSPLPTI